ncbi:MAG: saccharopine dehydrogenase NADP-binding domain-containing protein [candidate division WOR-3 bacterium]|nr:MAG: saccharopine dehydrogenase NADP-binding domain-containing protein [candidate division WOR-3 bacterium]
MKRVLVLGAGLVSRPMVRYLLAVPDFEVTVASRTLSRAEKLIAGHARGKAVQLLADQEQALDALVSAHDLTVSLLPYTYHVQVARHCLKHQRSMVTTSYVSDAMKELDTEARDAGILLLNEIGLDPGIDHMSAMSIVHRIQASGGDVLSFMSYCGGLPAPEANDNPLGYKFSWSPKGVVMAGRNPGRYLKDGKEVVVPGEELFGHHWPLDIEGEGKFEAYPNRDSLPYIGLYGIQKTRTMFRGTLRNPGWCETLKAIADLGLLDDRERNDLQGLTVQAWMLSYVPGEGDLRQNTAARLGLERDSAAVSNMAWLGMFGDEPVGIEKGSNLDIIAKLMLDRMSYKPGERDMIVLHHDFTAELPGRPEQHITSTLVDYGRPEGDSAMARTVSLPAAVAVKLALQGGVGLTGVHIPVVPELYQPVLSELESMGVVFKERGLDRVQDS